MLGRGRSSVIWPEKEGAAKVDATLIHQGGQIKARISSRPFYIWSSEKCWALWGKALAPSGNPSMKYSHQPAQRCFSWRIPAPTKQATKINHPRSGLIHLQALQGVFKQGKICFSIRAYVPWILSIVPVGVRSVSSLRFAVGTGWSVPKETEQHGGLQPLHRAQ